MSILYFVLAFLALGILVFVHELGHLFAAKMVGMKIEIFSIGFGKPIVRWQGKGINWQVGWLPFGGYVKIAGMDFSKKESGEESDPYAIEGGYFSKSPWARMFVAFSGPFVNFLFALLFFALIFVFGGYQKPFSGYTKFVGWVDPTSAVYPLGLRAGDLVLKMNRAPFEGTHTLFNETILGPSKITMQGEHFNYVAGQSSPFSYEIARVDFKDVDKPFVPLFEGANYLIYDRFGKNENPLPANSPMLESGIEYGDRLVWADGVFLFSLNQLKYLINDDRAFLLVNRGDHTFFSRQKRVQAKELELSNLERAELMDLSYEALLKKRWQELTILPYVINSDCVVERTLPFRDEQETKNASSLLGEIESPLLTGDRILAVDGRAIEKGHELLEALQSRKVNLLVEKNVSTHPKLLWNQVDSHFYSEKQLEEMRTLSSTVGTNKAQIESEQFKLLNPVTPKHYSEFQENAQVTLQKENPYMLGISFQDRLVIYNPNPFKAFADVMVQIWQTLKGLISAHVTPKAMAGPVGIVQLMHQSWQSGIAEGFYWVALISVNLGFINLLPLPVLDGGHILLSFFELVTRRRLKPKTLEKIIIPFAILLIALLLFFTFNDILRIFK